ncbi:cadherin-1-like isoform X2 [Clupea harengus]|nr:cadherin-1-like isoform X2 [Clupea harengus]
MDGTLTLKRQVTLHDGHKRFSVHAWDSQGRKHTVALRVELDQPRHNQHQHLHHPHQVDLLQPTQPNVTEAVPTVPVLLFPKSFGGLRRRKRDWIIPVIKIAENTRGPFPELLVQIKTSHSKELKIVYSITGAGADQPPLNLFTIDAETGTLYITQPLDREKHAHYLLFAHAVSVGGSKVEDPMELKVIVIDQNDNKPVFAQNHFLGSVAEASKIGTEFMEVVATDADEPKNCNSNVRYTILSQDPLVPNNAFSINPVTGKIMLNSAGLDKEKNSVYILEIQAADMEGWGLTAFCKAIITVTDSNDQAPQFEQTLPPQPYVTEAVPTVPVLLFPKSSGGL